MLYGGSLLVVIGCTYLFRDFSSPSPPGHPQNSDISENQAQYHRSMDRGTGTFSWFRCEHNTNNYGHDPSQHYNHHEIFSRDEQKVMERSGQSLHSMISDYNEVGENYMKANVSDYLECCKVAVVTLVVAKIVDVHWLRNQTVYKICGC